VLKAEILEVLKICNRDTIISDVARCWRRIWKKFRVLMQSWHNFMWRAAILAIVNFSYLS